MVEEYSAREGLNATNSSEFSLREFRDQPRKFKVPPAKVQNSGNLVWDSDNTTSKISREISPCVAVNYDKLKTSLSTKSERSCN